MTERRIIEKVKVIMKNNNLNTPTAIFIDGSWLYATTKRINKNVDYAIFFNILIKKFGAKTKIYYYGVIDPTNKQQEKFYISLKKIGYIIHCIKLRKIGDRVISSGLDISLAVDAMRILPSLKNFKKEAKIERFVDQNYIKKGDSFKSYIKLRNLMESAKNSITIVDSYIDDQILLMIQPLKPEINKIIITNTDKITPADFFIQVQKLKRDGHLINIYKSEKFHDRFICIDDIWWHSGHSFKNLGEKDSMFNKVTEETAKKINTRMAEAKEKII